MISEVNEELYQLCDRAATGLIENIRSVLSENFAKTPVPESWSSKGLTYTDYLAYRSGGYPLENLGAVKEWASEGIRMELKRLSESELFALAAYFMENREQVAQHDDDPSPDAEVPNNSMPTDEEMIDFILGCWEDELYDRYEDVQPKVTDADAITLVDGRKPITCPYCGGRVLPIVYGEPTEETWKKTEEGKVILGGCCIRAEGGDPEWECNQCGQWFRRK